MDHSHESSHKLYMAAISEISAGIAKGTLTGTEDSLLATVIWLCVYEVRLTSSRLVDVYRLLTIVIEFES